MKNFKNVSNNWQCWADVFTSYQALVFEGTEIECDKFLVDNDPNMNMSDYGSLFMIAPHTGRYENFEKFDC